MSANKNVPCYNPSFFYDINGAHFAMMVTVWGFIDGGSELMMR